MAVALCERGMFTWDEFRAHLIAEIERWERQNTSGAEYQYYERWVAALGNLLLDRGVCSRGEIEDQEEHEQKVQLEGAA
jgi:nitrile hydratase accessory protein